MWLVVWMWSFQRHQISSQFRIRKSDNLITKKLFCPILTSYRFIFSLSSLSLFDNWGILKSMDSIKVLYCSDNSPDFNFICTLVRLFQFISFDIFIYITVYPFGLFRDLTILLKCSVEQVGFLLISNPSYFLCQPWYFSLKHVHLLKILFTSFNTVVCWNSIII